jgi:hypothetical protein
MNVKPGMKFGHITTIARDGANKHRKVTWKCRCDCGKLMRKVVAGNLVSGGSSSCGCIGRAKTIKRNKELAKHGMGGTSEYDIWYGMMSRCNDKRDNVYHNYGGRGIRVCEFISDHPANLFHVVGKRPKCSRPRQYSLDRKDNDSHYSCGGCKQCKAMGWKMNLRWATQKDQCRNARFNRMITIGGLTKCLSEWGEISGLKPHTIRTRIELGWPSEKLLTPLSK